MNINLNNTAQVNKKVKERKIKGITLIALVITIIVLLILAGVSIAMLTGQNGILNQANEAKFKNDLAGYKEQLGIYKTSKKLGNNEFKEDSLNASKENLQYNTKPSDETGNIKTIIQNLGKEYEEKVEVIKGQLIYNTKDVKEIKWLQELGIEPNPYEIVGGELLSSDGNLLLMDSTGTLTIPGTVTKIGDGAFRNLSGLKTIIIPGSCKEIGNYAFSGNNTLENVIIENGVEKIGNFAFENCRALKEINLPNSVISIGNTCFGGCISLQTANLSSSLKEIPYRAFSGCTKLGNIEILENINTIKTYSFEFCNNINKIKIPASVNNIEGGAFTNMPNLTEIEISSENQNYKFENGLLLSKDGTELYNGLMYLTTINIPNTVTNIKALSLVSCNKATIIQIPDSVLIISTIFSNSVKEINVGEGNTKFKSINGNLYDKKVETLIKYCSNESEVTLPSTLKKIKSDSFTGQSNIKKLNLPETIENLESGAINGTSITELFISKNIVNISPTAFTGRNITVTVSEENTKYKSIDGIYITDKEGKKLLIVSKNLDIYNIPEEIETIGENAFYNKTLLKTIKLPNKIKIIENSAFDVSVNLSKIEIPSSIETIGTSAFSRCKNLTDIIIHKPQGSIAGAPWGAPYGLRAVKWD